MVTLNSGKSLKYSIIDKDSTVVVITVAVAIMIITFCLFSFKALLSQSSFNRRVISEKKVALNQAEANKENVEKLRANYTAFVSEEKNILGGSSKGKGTIDGDNAQLVLDALPGSYDFPALSSSMEKILKDGGYKIDSIGGSDTVVDASLQASLPAVGGAVEIPYSFSVSSSMEGTLQLLKTLERSIRPIHITSLNFQSTDIGLRSSIGFKTFYAPAVNFQPSQLEVK